MNRVECMILIVKLGLKFNVKDKLICDYSNAYILVKRTMTVTNTVTVWAAVNKTNKQVIFKNCAPFTSCINRINNMQIDDAKYIDVVISMYNLIYYGDNCSKTFGILWQYCREKPATAINNNIVKFVDGTDDNLTDSFNVKVKPTG